MGGRRPHWSFWRDKKSEEDDTEDEDDIGWAKPGPETSPAKWGNASCNGGALKVSDMQRGPRARCSSNGLLGTNILEEEVLLMGDISPSPLQHWVKGGGPGTGGDWDSRKPERGPLESSGTSPFRGPHNRNGTNLKRVASDPCRLGRRSSFNHRISFGSTRKTWVWGAWVIWLVLVAISGYLLVATLLDKMGSSVVHEAPTTSGTLKLVHNGRNREGHRKSGKIGAGKQGSQKKGKPAKPGGKTVSGSRPKQQDASWSSMLLQPLHHLGLGKQTSRTPRPPLVLPAGLEELGTDAERLWNGQNAIANSSFGRAVRHKRVLVVVPESLVPPGTDSLLPGGTATELIAQLAGRAIEHGAKEVKAVLLGNGGSLIALPASSGSFLNRIRTEAGLGSKERLLSRWSQVQVLSGGWELSWAAAGSADVILAASVAVGPWLQGLAERQPGAVKLVAWWLLETPAKEERFKVPAVMEQVGAVVFWSRCQQQAWEGAMAGEGGEAVFQKLQKATVIQPAIHRGIALATGLVEESRVSPGALATVKEHRAALRRWVRRLVGAKDDEVLVLVGGSKTKDLIRVVRAVAATMEDLGFHDEQESQVDELAETKDEVVAEADASEEGLTGKKSRASQGSDSEEGMLQDATRTEEREPEKESNTGAEEGVSDRVNNRHLLANKPQGKSANKSGKRHKKHKLKGPDLDALVVEMGLGDVAPADVARAESAGSADLGAAAARVAKLAAASDSDIAKLADALDVQPSLLRSASSAQADATDVNLVRARLKSMVRKTRLRKNLNHTSTLVARASSLAEELTPPPALLSSPLRVLLPGGWEGVLEESWGGHVGLQRALVHLPMNHSRLSKAALLAGADLFLLSQQEIDAAIYAEVLEALAYGLPVLATRSSTALEFLEDGENALLHTSEEPGVEELSLHLSRLVSEPTLLAQLGKAASGRVRDHEVEDRFLGQVGQILLRISAPEEGTQAAVDGKATQGLGRKQLV